MLVAGSFCRYTPYFQRKCGINDSFDRASPFCVATGEAGFGMAICTRSKPETATQADDDAHTLGLATGTAAYGHRCSPKDRLEGRLDVASKCIRGTEAGPVYKRLDC